MAAVWMSGTQTGLLDFLRQGLVTRGYAMASQPAEASSLIAGPRASATDTFDDIQGLVRQMPSLKRLIFLSSAEIYGEGEFECGDCGVMPNAHRQPEQWGRWRWEVFCPICDEMMMPRPVTETSLAEPRSPWGHELLHMERELAVMASKVAFPMIRLRLFLPYWPRHSFVEAENPMVIARFTQQLLNEEPLTVYEDGNGMRDFTHAGDIVDAIDQIIRMKTVDSGAYNVGSGQRLPIYELAAYLQEFLGKTHVPYTLAEQHREGDVRHRFGDITKAQQGFGYQPRYGILEGLQAYAQELLQASTPLV